MDQIESLDLQAIKKRAAHGVLTLTLRTFFLQAVNQIAIFILTILLTPAVYGAFFLVSAVVNFLIYFSDIGLAAALIQKKESLTREDLVTTFTIQQSLVIALVVLSLVVSSPVGGFYQLGPAGVWLFRSLAIAFFLSSLKTIPSVLLERELDFSRLIIPQVVETLVFNVVVVVLAWQGWGIVSFTVAVFLRGLAGLITIYLVRPWRPGLGFSKQVAKKLLHFGVPFQANSLLALVKDDLQTAFLGKVLTLTEVGYLGWAQKWAFQPLRLFMDNVNKVTFPSFSRLQEDLANLKSALEKAIFATCAATFPLLGGLAVLAEPLVKIIPRYGKWEPALLPLYLFAFNAVLACISSTLTNALNATGRVKLTLKLMVMWTVLTWLLVPVLVWRFGYLGAALASAVIAVSSLMVIWLVRRLVAFDLWQPVLVPALASLIMTGMVFWLSRTFPVGPVGLLVSVIMGAGIYLTALLVLSQGAAWVEVQGALRLVRGK